jgi:psp operon transcriptional activator
LAIFASMTRGVDMSRSTAGLPLPEGIGESEAFLEFQQKLSRVAQVNRPVLIVGERGSGKELVASRLHFLSPRWQGPLVALSCAALAPSLLETELFGHEPGAFTGADRKRTGRFEAAHEGTLFLDEIGLIPMEVQEKILRVVEYGTFERVGSSSPIQVEVRIIGATNADLPGLVALGKFKSDLLDRLAFEVLKVPPLRERQGDVMLLARHFATRMAKEMGRAAIPIFSPKAVGLLECHGWPGNVRELKNVVERAVYRCENDLIDDIDFDPFGNAPAAGFAAPPQTVLPGTRPPQPRPPFQLGKQTLPEALRELESRALCEALAAARYHQGEAARLLGLSYHQFRALYRKYKTGLEAVPELPVARAHQERPGDGG